MYHSKKRSRMNIGRMTGGGGGIKMGAAFVTNNKVTTFLCRIVFFGRGRGIK